MADAHVLVDAYFAMEDPAAIRPIGLELQLEAQVGGLLMRGIIDRLELDAEGELVVTDYKTGRSPAVQYEQGRLGGVHFYAYLCEQAFGRRPSIIRLMYLRDGIIIEARPTERSVRFLPKRTEAVWRAVDRACETGDFKPRPGRLCPLCAFQDVVPRVRGRRRPGRARGAGALRPRARPAAAGHHRRAAHHRRTGDAGPPAQRVTPAASVARFDAAFDAALEQLRGHPVQRPHLPDGLGARRLVGDLGSSSARHGG